MPTSSPRRLTPIQEQYYRIKQNYPDALLFFRLGDFYELFGDDAKIASETLQIVLTAREFGQESENAHVRRARPMRRKGIWGDCSRRDTASRFANRSRNRDGAWWNERWCVWRRRAR